MHWFISLFSSSLLPSSYLIYFFVECKKKKKFIVLLYIYFQISLLLFLIYFFFFLNLSNLFFYYIFFQIPYFWFLFYMCDISYPPCNHVTATTCRSPFINLPFGCFVYKHQFRAKQAIFSVTSVGKYPQNFLSVFWDWGIIFRSLLLMIWDFFVLCF